MDPRKIKAVSDWLHSTVFKDEPIRSGQYPPRPCAPASGPAPARRSPPPLLPAPLREARAMESGDDSRWRTRAEIFLRQAKLLAEYEDDYACPSVANHYYPTYQVLTDEELRGYFTWRTRLRRGDVRKTGLTYAFLYIYELINQAGVADAMDGYRRLLEFQEVYGKLDDRIKPYLAQWQVDYAYYYDLDPALLAGEHLSAQERNAAVLERIHEHSEAEVIAAVKNLSTAWLVRSRFYKEYTEDVDAVIVRVLRRMSDYYIARYKRPMADRYCGSRVWDGRRPFSAAVFADPLNRRDYEYLVDGQCVCRCENGQWGVLRRVITRQSIARLTDLLKTIDAVMRQIYGDPHPIKTGTEAKWILKIIEEETRARLAEKRAAEAAKISIDYSRLGKIRQDAAATRERLIVEEETEPAARETVPSCPAPEEPSGPDGAPPLDPAERRLVRCLLYGGDLGWVLEEGLLLSVLVDGVNEKLYDLFLDSVLSDEPQVLEDYIDDLKEMVGP